MEVQKFYYDNQIVKKFLYATLLWGVVGMSVGLLLAFMPFLQEYITLCNDCLKPECGAIF